MKKQQKNTTPFGWRCLDVFLTMCDLLWVIRWLGAITIICALFTPAAGQSVQSMVKNMPFPYAQGVAMDTTLYKNVKAKLEAADLLRINSAKSISDLQAQIKGTYAALEDSKKLGKYEAKQADSLRAVLAIKIGLLQTATGDLQRANSAFTDVLGSLPRRVRKQLTGATPATIALAVDEYIDLLQARKWKWSGVAVGVGFLGSLIVLIR